MSLATGSLEKCSLGTLFTCSHVNGYTRIRTPFLYPDGDVIDLFIQERDDSIVITDLGETLRWLRSQTISPRRTPNQNKLISDICLNHNIQFVRGTLVAYAASQTDLSAVLMRVAQGALRVADIWFTTRTRLIESVSADVESLLIESDIPFERSQPITGRSGRSWRPDFHIKFPRRDSLMCVLSTGSRTAAKGVVEHVLATWYDLHHLKHSADPLRFISLFDDTLDVWNEYDLDLLRDLSTIARYSELEQFLHTLTP